jgi:hypothetical protein
MLVDFEKQPLIFSSIWALHMCSTRRAAMLQCTHCLVLLHIVETFRGDANNSNSPSSAGSCGSDSRSSPSTTVFEWQSWRLAAILESLHPTT